MSPIPKVMTVSCEPCGLTEVPLSMSNDLYAAQDVDEWFKKLAADIRSVLRKRGCDCKTVYLNSYPRRKLVANRPRGSP